MNKRPLTHVGALLEGQPLTLAKLIGMDIWPVQVQLPDDDLAVNVTARQLIQIRKKKRGKIITKL